MKHKCPQIMANSKDDQDQKGKYLETSRKILSQEMIMCNMKALIFRSNDQCQFFLTIGHVKVKRLSPKSLELTVLKLLARLKFSKSRPNKVIHVLGVFFALKN